MKLSWRLSPRNLLLVLLIGLSCIAGFILVQFAFIDFFIWLGWETQSAEFKIAHIGEYVTYIVTVCVLVPFIEELLFRLGVVLLLKFLFDKIVFKRPTPTGDILSVVISAALFALYHLSFSQLVYQFILGLIFASVFIVTRNILYPFFLHFINNFFVVTYTFIAGSDTMYYDWNAYTIITGIVLAIMGGAVILTLIKNLRKENNATKHPK